MTCQYCGADSCTYQQLLPFKTYIAGYIRKNKGVSPTVREIAAKFKISISTVHKRINRMVETGHIRRLPNRARAIEVI